MTLQSLCATIPARCPVPGFVTSLPHGPVAGVWWTEAGGGRRLRLGPGHAAAGCSLWPRAGHRHQPGSGGRGGGGRHDHQHHLQVSRSASEGQRQTGVLPLRIHSVRRASTDQCGEDRRYGRYAVCGRLAVTWCWWCQLQHQCSWWCQFQHQCSWWCQLQHQCSWCCQLQHQCSWWCQRHWWRSSSCHEALLVNDTNDTMWQRQWLPASVTIPLSARVGSASPAERIPLADGSCQLVMTVQACHWFNMASFLPEVARALAVGGTLALVGYRLPAPLWEGTERTDVRDLLATVSTSRVTGLPCCAVNINNLDIPLRAGL